MQSSPALQTGAARAARDWSAIPSPERAAAAAAPRPNFYLAPHKALRLALGDALAAAGRVDPHDDADVARLAAHVCELVAFCRAHLEKEEEIVHPAMEARRPGSAAATRGEHLDHRNAFARLEAGARALEGARGSGREAAAAALYRQLALFVADNLVHMHEEETVNNAVLWAEYTDEELAALEQRIVGSIPPAMLQFALSWMVPAMNPGERAALLSNIRAHAPAPAFEALLAGVQSRLTEAERRKLAQALN
jgi:hypothetical protein